MLRERWPRIKPSVERGKNWFANSENSMQDALTDMVKILTDAQGTGHRSYTRRGDQSQAIKVSSLKALMNESDPTDVAHHVVKAVLKFYQPNPNRIPLQKADGAKEAACVVIDKMSAKDKAQKAVDIHKMKKMQVIACALEFSIIHARRPLADVKNELAGFFCAIELR